MSDPSLKVNFIELVDQQLPDIPGVVEGDVRKSKPPTKPDRLTMVPNKIVLIDLIRNAQAGLKPIKDKEGIMHDRKSKQDYNTTNDKYTTDPTTKNKPTNNDEEVPKAPKVQTKNQPRTSTTKKRPTRNQLQPTNSILKFIQKFNNPENQPAPTPSNTQPPKPTQATKSPITTSVNLQPIPKPVAQEYQPAPIPSNTQPPKPTYPKPLPKVANNTLDLHLPTQPPKLPTLHPKTTSKVASIAQFFQPINTQNNHTTQAPNTLQVQPQPIPATRTDVERREEGVGQGGRRQGQQVNHLQREQVEENGLPRVGKGGSLTRRKTAGTRKGGGMSGNPSNNSGQSTIKSFLELKNKSKITNSPCFPNSTNQSQELEARMSVFDDGQAKNLSGEKTIEAENPTQHTETQLEGGKSDDQYL